MDYLGAIAIATFYTGEIRVLYEKNKILNNSDKSLIIAQAKFMRSSKVIAIEMLLQGCDEIKCKKKCFYKI